MRISIELGRARDIRDSEGRGRGSDLAHVDGEGCERKHEKNEDDSNRFHRLWVGRVAKFGRDCIGFVEFGVRRILLSFLVQSESEIVVSLGVFGF